MKRIVLIYGLILGAIFTGNMFYMVYRCYTETEMHTNDVLGYAAMVVVSSLTFFGIRNYRNKELNGYISFGRALKTGTLIAFTGATFYVVVGLAGYYLVFPDFLDKYIPHVLNEAARDGATPEQLAEKTQELADFKEMYKNPVFVVFVTYLEVFPIAFVVAVISAFILKRPEAEG